MKKLLILMSLFLGIGTFVMGQGTILGSAHDFSDATWMASADSSVCMPCHTPHHAMDLSDAPLWNHDTTDATFVIYSSSTLDASIQQPSGISRLCMGCHDGTIAIDSYGGATGTNFLTGTDAGYVGTDLSNDHPISFTYDAALATADGELYDPSTGTTPIGGTIANDLLFGGNMECSSCHDVHNTSAVTDHLLIIDNAGSTLCLTCHDK